MKVPLVAVALMVAACGGASPSPAPWGEFQSRVLDAMEQNRGKDVGDTATLEFFREQQAWAKGVTADPCYDPALRAYRAWLEDMILAFSIVSGRDLDDVPVEELQAALAAMEESVENDKRLSAAMTAATDVCNR